MKRIFIGLTFVFLSSILFAQSRVYAPEPVAPDNEETEIFPEVYVDWTAVTGTGSISYELMIDTDPTFATTTPIITDLSAYLASDLLFGVTYYWKVRAKDDNNTSDWTETWSFTVISNMILDKPNNEPNPEIEDYRDPETKMSWDPIDGVDSYEVQYDTTFYFMPFSSGTDENLNDVFTISENDAWLVGDGGLVKHYNGMFWLDEASGATENLLAVGFANDALGWVAGEAGEMFEYSAGTWTEISIDNGGSPFEGDILSFYVMDENFAWAGGEGGIIAKFDAGAWVVTATLSGDVNSIDFVDANNGWAVCAGGDIYHYDGTSWNMQFNAGEDLNSVSFFDINNGVAAGNAETIVLYNGTEWMPVIYEMLDGDNFAAKMISADMAFVFGEGDNEENLYIYNGTNWSRNASGAEPPMHACHITDGMGWAVGEEGFMLSYGGEAFNSPFAKMISYPGTDEDTLFSNLPFGAKMFWRMRAVHAGDVSPWSAVWTFRVIDSVDLKAPVSGAEDEDMQVKLRWAEIDGVDGYTCEVDRDPNFTNPVSFTSSDSLFIFANVKYFGTKYYWRANTYHEFDQSKWNVIPFEFTTLDYIELVEPENGNIDVSRLPLLEWDTVKGVSHFKVQYGTDPNFATSIGSELTLDGRPQFQVNYLLDEGQIIYWRVKAFTSKDSSEWSQVWQFKTLNVGVEENLADKLEIYPNPANDVVNIDFEMNQNSKVIVEVLDLLGQSYLYEELSLDAGFSNKKFRTAGLASGVYLIRIEQNNKVHTQKLIIDK